MWIFKYKNKDDTPYINVWSENDKHISTMGNARCTANGIFFFLYFILYILFTSLLIEKINKKIKKL